MKTILFNIHDLVLVAILVLCGLLAMTCAQSGKFGHPSRNLLIAFFALNGAIAFDTLVFWGEGVKFAAFDVSPWLLTALSFASFAFGPILLWVVRAETSMGTYSKWVLGLHMLPAVATPFYLYWVCYRYPIDIQRELILNLSVYSVPWMHFSSFVTLKALSPAVYGIFSVMVFYRASKDPSKSTSDLIHFLYLTGGFALIRIWILLTHLCGVWLPFVSSDLMGIIGNYMTLLLLIGLVFLILMPANTGKKMLPDDEVEPQQPDAGAEAMEVVQRIRIFSEREKPYLNSRLNLERFAELLDLPPRQVSSAINRGFKKTFQEYINEYRIAEAKRLLSDVDHAALSIIEIAERAGFNSKATFNRIFKNYESVPPTVYRQQCLANNSARPCHQ